MVDERIAVRQRGCPSAEQDAIVAQHGLDRGRGAELLQADRRSGPVLPELIAHPAAGAARAHVTLVSDREGDVRVGTCAAVIRDRCPEIGAGIVSIVVHEIAGAVPTPTGVGCAIDDERTTMPAPKAGYIRALRPIVRYGIPLPEVRRGEIG